MSDRGRVIDLDARVDAVFRTFEGCRFLPLPVPSVFRTWVVAVGPEVFGAEWSLTVPASVRYCLDWAVYHNERSTGLTL